MLLLSRFLFCGRCCTAGSPQWNVMIQAQITVYWSFCDLICTGFTLRRHYMHGPFNLMLSTVSPGRRISSDTAKKSEPTSSEGLPKSTQQSTGLATIIVRIYYPKLMRVRPIKIMKNAVSSLSPLSIQHKGIPDPCWRTIGTCWDSQQPKASMNPKLSLAIDALRTSGICLSRHRLSYPNLLVTTLMHH